MSANLSTKITHRQREFTKQLLTFHLPTNAPHFFPRSTSTVEYDSLISYHCKKCNIAAAMSLLTTMLRDSIHPTSFTLVPILSHKNLDFFCGIHMHALLTKEGLLHSEPYSATALLTHYARSGRMDNVVKLFDEMPVKNVVSYNSIISGFGNMGCARSCFSMFNELLRSEMRPSEYSFLAVISMCRELENSCLLEQVHSMVLKLSLDRFTVVSNVLLSAYLIFFESSVCEKLFSEHSIKDLVTWNTKIASFARSDMPEQALKAFSDMLLSGFLPNENTFASALVACVGMSSQISGEIIHATTIKHNLNTNVYVGSALVHFYAKSKSSEYAVNRVFSDIPGKNEATWNALICNSSIRYYSSFPSLIKEMMFSGCKPNEFTFSSTLRKVTALDVVQFHCLIIKLGYENFEYVTTSLIASYDAHGMISDALACFSTLAFPPNSASYNVVAAMCNRAGQYEDTKKMLLQVQYPSAISWNILLAACARNKDYFEVLRLFKKMQFLGCSCDNYTAVTLLSVCSKTNSLYLGCSIHGLIIKSKAGDSEVFVSNILINMYSKCGNLEGCRRVFYDMKERNLISWTTFISGLGVHGYAQEALNSFEQMELEGYKLDRVVFIAALSACRHSGKVEQGKMLFEKMKFCYGIEPDMDHYLVLVDLLCKYGHTKEAEHVICEMPFQPNGAIWRTFLQGCKT